MNTMKQIVVLVLAAVTVCAAHNSYTGGYSGAPGGKGTCATCHGGSGGTIQASGFPASYSPGQTYTITITHNGGNKFVNVNASTRLGTTTVVAGTFIAGSNTALYPGDGIYVSPHLIDALAFQWTAPGAGSGPVTFYAAGFQGTSTGSSSGQSSKLSITATEATTGVAPLDALPQGLLLLQNYPNPFNPETTVRFSVRENGFATVKILNMLGQEVATVFRGMARAGDMNTATFNAGMMASGMYFSRLECNGKSIVQKMILAK